MKEMLADRKSNREYYMFIAYIILSTIIFLLILNLCNDKAIFPMFPVQFILGGR